MGTRKLFRPDYPVVALPSFIQATRDSGYKSTAAAISELVDNSLEAGASRIDITLAEAPEPHPIQIEVVDNGAGMSRDLLPLSLQFGGTTRFNKRDGLGRYGMGLPNGGLSQARCIEVLTWQSPQSVWMVRLALDEITSGSTMHVAPPVHVSDVHTASRTGTIVRLRACDRLDSRRISTHGAPARSPDTRVHQFRTTLSPEVTVAGRTLLPIRTEYFPAGKETGWLTCLDASCAPAESSTA